MKGCLSVSAYRIGEGLSCSAYPISQGLVIYATRVGGNIRCKAEMLDERINVSASRIGERIRVSAHHICTVNKASFLNVVPDMVWLSPDELASADFEIISNVKWLIE